MLLAIGILHGPGETSESAKVGETSEVRHILLDCVAKGKEMKSH